MGASVTSSAAGGILGLPALLAAAPCVCVMLIKDMDATRSADVPHPDLHHPHVVQTPYTA